MTTEKDENSSGNLIPEDARGDIAKKALGEAATNFGKEIAPLGHEVGSLTVRSVRLLMKPLQGVVWGGERIWEWLETAVSEKLRAVPEEKRTEPDPRIALPALQALVYTGSDESIRDLFANLISADMNADTKADAHPAFVEIIKEMTASEAKIVKHIHTNGPQVKFTFRALRYDYSGYRDLASTFTFAMNDLRFNSIEIGLSNLSRLGLVNLDDGKYPADEVFEEATKAILASGQKEKFAEQLGEGHRIELNKTGIFLTPLGESFAKVCVS